MNVKLSTSGDQLNALQHSVNEARDTSETIRVDRAALRALLLDHHAMFSALSCRGQTPATPESGG
jgi:hypothetical protein